METRDLSQTQLRGENEIDNAMLAAFLDLPALERADVSLMEVA